eukprot:s9023_g3.t1
MWRLGSTKAQEGFPFVQKIKYLGVKLSYGNFEQATLQYRLQEGNVKLQKVRKYVHNRRTKYLGVKLSYGNFEQATLQYRLQEGNVKLQKVRKYVHNRRTAGPKARLHIWNATVWATVASGLADVGLTTDTATKLRAWHAAKIRAVLNKPAHLTHIYVLMYGIKDPVQELADRQSNRVKRLEHRSSTAHPDDVSTCPAALEQANQKLVQYQDLLARQPHLAETPESARTAIRHSRHPRALGAPNPHRKGAPGHRRQVCACNLSRKIRRALRGAPPCTPVNRCSETQHPRIRP